MAHDVFISYSSRDKTVADAVCASLESRKIRCWIAPRDVLPGVPYAEALIEGLNQSSLVVLVFSQNSNTSPQVMREMERAVHKGIPIIPFRIEDVMPSKSMEYFVSSSHWLDAMTPPLEMHLQRLADTVQVLLSGGNTSLAEPVPSATSPTTINVKPKNKALPLIVVASVVVALAVIGVIFLTGGFGRLPKGPNLSSPASKPAATSAPGLKAEGLLYEDNFDNPSSGWKKFSDESQDSNYENGEYSLTVKKWNWGNWVANRNAGRFADMILDIDTRLVSGSFQSGYGVVFRVQNDDSFYRCLLSGQGAFRIDKRTGGVIHVLQKYTDSPFINQGNTANHLKVTCKGPQIDVACNGHDLVSIKDTSFSDGFVGVAVTAVEPPATAHFDNLSVRAGN
ncbi:MAG: TIR domain-containing protein [Dehalococcoidia bacterium]|jgi:hypothetical protein